MAGPEPRDFYNATPSVAPNTTSSNDYISSRATPQDFGAQVGQAVTGLGQTVGKMGDEATQLAVQRQGQINETWISQADDQYAVQAGDLYGKFKTLTGLDALTAKDGVVQNIVELRNKLRDSLPSDAVRRGFDQLALRREAYMVQDMNAYTAGQVKAAHTAALKSAAQIALDSTSDFNIASNPAMWGAALGDMKHNLVSAFTEDEGYASVTHMDLKTGQVTFDNSPQGKQAEAEWTNLWNQNLGKAWANRLKIMALDPVHGNFETAVKELEAHGPHGDNTIPRAAYAELSQTLTPGYKARVMADTTNKWLSTDSAEYQDTITGSANPSVTSGYEGVADADKPVVSAVAGHETIHFDEKSPGPDKKFTHAGLGQFDVGTWKQVTGQDIPAGVVGTNDDPRLHADASLAAIARYAHMNADKFRAEMGRDPTVTELALMHQQGPGGALKLFKAYQTNPNAIATSVLPSNVLTSNGVPPNATVAQAISHIESFYGGSAMTVPGQPGGSKTYMSQASFLIHNYQDLYNKHYAELMQNEWYQNNPQAVQQQMADWERGAQRIIHAQQEQVYGYKTDIIDYLKDKANKGQSIVNPAQLYADPATRDKMLYLDANDSNASYAIQTRVIPGLNQHKAPTFGTNFYGSLADVMSGAITSADQLSLNMIDVDQKHQPLTNTGFGVLSSIQRDMASDPNKKAAYQAFFAKLSSKEIRGAVTPTGSIPGVSDKDLDARFENFLMVALPQFQAGLAKGIKASDLLDITNKDYVFKDLPRYTMKDVKADILKSVPVNPASFTYHPPIPFNMNSIKDKQSLYDAAKSGKITKEQFADYVKKHPEQFQSAPPVPTPH